MHMKRAAVIAILLITSLCGYVWFATAEHSLQSTTSRKRRRMITDAFEHVWNGYAKHCMGHDSVHPISNSCSDDFGGWGVTAIESLTTAIMFGKEDIATSILRHVATLDFTIAPNGKKVQLAEVTTRHLAAMISAHDLLNGPFVSIARDESLREALYRQMIRLGGALSCGFSTPSGLPRNHIDVASCTTDSSRTNTVASVGTLILEFTRLSEIASHSMYAQLVRRAVRHLVNPQPAAYLAYPGLLGSSVSVHNGWVLNRKGSYDSFYEYLLKAYIYNPALNEQHLDRWKMAADSLIKHIASHPYRKSWTLLPCWEGERLFNVMDSSSWSAGADFILGGMVTNNDTLVDFGLSIADTAGALYGTTATGLGGEMVAWTVDCSAEWDRQPCSSSNSVVMADPTFTPRHEVLETWYYAYRATRDPKYRDWAWSVFQAIGTLCWTPTAFSAISDVHDPSGGVKLDLETSHAWLRYIYMIHLEDEDVAFHVQDGRNGKINNWVFNTEGHPLRAASLSS